MARCIPSPSIAIHNYVDGAALVFVCEAHNVKFTIVDDNGISAGEISIDHFLELIRHHQGIVAP